VRPFDIRHDDPVSLARTAAIRSRIEQDPQTREEMRNMTPSQRLQLAFELSRSLTRLRPAR
jgi:hypothetical protein